MLQFSSESEKMSEASLAGQPIHLFAASAQLEKLVANENA